MALLRENGAYDRNHQESTEDALQVEDDYIVLHLLKKNHEFVLTAVEVALDDVGLERQAD